MIESIDQLDEGVIFLYLSPDLRSYLACSCLSKIGEKLFPIEDGRPHNRAYYDMCITASEDGSCLCKCVNCGKSHHYYVELDRIVITSIVINI
jgi:hypothetical protein